jgi:hypothetical protein
VSLEAIAIGILGLAQTGLGYVFVFRTEIALSAQERFAETLSSTPPSENPTFYANTEAYRSRVFRLGGVVLGLFGVALVTVAVFILLFVPTFPR